MLLGKRPRPPLKRTTSMKDVVVELSTASEASKPSDLEIPRAVDGNQLPRSHGDWNSDRRPNLTAASPLSLSVMVSPGGMRRSSTDYAAAVDAAPFLRACALCKGFLRSGRDIFMYRGEIAFCSSECRERRIKLDERKEKVKLSISSTKNSAPANAEASKASGKGETAVAA